MGGWELEMEGGEHRDVCNSENNQWPQRSSPGEKWRVAVGSDWVWVKFISSFGYRVTS